MYKFIFLRMLFIALFFSCFPDMHYEILLAEGKNNDITDEAFPEDFPLPVVDSVNNPAPGYFFISANSGKTAGASLANYLMILDSAGKVQAYKRAGATNESIPRSFTQTPCGLMTHVDEMPGHTKANVWDLSFNKLDSFLFDNNDRTVGSLDILPNGHYVLNCRETMQMDLSKIVDGGNPNAEVRYNTSYEYDVHKNLVFQWRSIDFLPIDATYSDTLASRVDFTHINKTTLDYDGNYLLSSRALSSIIKVNRSTGEIMWILGGKLNQFTFIGENEDNAPTYFSEQHHIRRLANGNISMFDNGVQHDPQYSRAVEYKLDIESKTATMVWDYRQDPDVFAKAEGSSQRLANGNVVIGWGEASLKGGPAVTEVKPDNSIACQISLPEGFKSMMTGKFPWKYDKPSASVYKEILEGNTYDFSKNGKTTCTKMNINKLEELPYSTVYVDKYDFAPMYPDFEETQAPLVKNVRIVITFDYIKSLEAEIHFSAPCLGLTYKPELYKVYHRDTAGQGVFKQLPTTYDENAGELIVTSTMEGEYIFGIPVPETAPAAPVLLYPEDNEKVNETKPVHIQWSPSGLFTSSQLQIAIDPEFTDPVLDTNGLKDINFTFDGAESGKTYYWKVRMKNGTMEGEWSDTRIFLPAGPYISMKVPNGGEVWEKDSVRRIIRWDKNIDDRVRIELVRNGDDANAVIIADSLDCPTGAYSWIIPQDIPSDSTYKIRVASISDGSLTSVSDENFTIAGPVSVEKGGENIVNILKIGNFPNPVDKSTTIEFSLDKPSIVTIKLFDSRGRDVKTLYKAFTEAGSHTINYTPENLIPGVYYYRISAGTNYKTGNMVIMK